MNYLEKRLVDEGIVIDESILKVNHFLNQQIDLETLYFAGKSFANYFAERGINKILTVEASGIAFAVATAFCLDGIPLVFAKKGNSKLNGDDHSVEIFSFTKKQSYRIWVEKRLLTDDDKILIVDDFLANGNAVFGLIELCKQAKAEVVGIGIVIEKSFQDGRKRLVEAGYDLCSLAKIKSLKDNLVEILE